MTVKKKDKAIYMNVSYSGEIVKWRCPKCGIVWDSDRFKKCPKDGFKFVRKDAVKVR